MATVGQTWFSHNTTFRLYRIITTDCRRVSITVCVKNKKQKKQYFNNISTQQVTRNLKNLIFLLLVFIKNSGHCLSVGSVLWRNVTLHQICPGLFCYLGRPSAHRLPQVSICQVKSIHVYLPRRRL